MASPKTTPPGPPQIPPLEPGDHLTREEFERRYDAMPGLKKAELIEGVVYMPSPVRIKRPASPHADFVWWLNHYRIFTPGVRVGDNGTVRLDLGNEPQPDALMIVEPEFGGQATISEDDYLEGGPELVGEVAASSASFDLHTKLEVYRRNQVREYIVWRVLDQTIDWFVRRQGQFARLPLSSDDSYRSEVFPGLWLDPAALARSDMGRVYQVLQQGLNSPDHVAFVARLQQQKR